MKEKNKYKLPTKPVLYIAYGSNINLEQMAYRCPHSTAIGTAKVKGWELEFRGVATIVPKENAEVPVLLWELDPRDIPALNRYEGFPRLYRQEEIEFEIGGKKLVGMAYLMNCGGISPPSQQYLQTIWDGYKDNGLDTSYLVEAAARAYDHQSEINLSHNEFYDPDENDDEEYDEDEDEDEELYEEDEDNDIDEDSQVSFEF